MLVTNKKLRSSSPFTLGNRVIFQTFGVDVIKTCVNPSNKVIKTSEDFIGYNADGDYTSANYTRNMYKNTGEEYSFTSNEVYDIQFEDSSSI